jgi:hypothetical protein
MVPTSVRAVWLRRHPGDMGEPRVLIVDDEPMLRAVNAAAPTPS